MQKVTTPLVVVCCDEIARPVPRELSTFIVLMRRHRHTWTVSTVAAAAAAAAAAEADDDDDDDV